MDVVRIFKTASYDEDYKRLDYSEKLRVDSIVKGLFDAGYVTGKPLGLPFFREKKFGGKRVLYLVYKPKSAILLLAIIDKKMQQATINAILLRLEEYERHVSEKLREATGSGRS
ncbi:hypothetical protein HYV82_06675 [Candidatus Woesearchaeota archaeon]|nr:hypothetical protein [Candidatus Woesearchaeota archaeon]